MMRGAYTVDEYEAAEGLLCLFYGGEDNARAAGALPPVSQRPVLDVTAVTAGPARIRRRRTRTRRQRAPRRHSSSSSEEESPAEDAVPIGSGLTKISKEKYMKIRWQNYRFATRSFLDALFSKRVLATHSVTGKPSPAFSDIPAKKRLNPMIVKDIVLEVSKKFNMAPNLVRAVITTKCADESNLAKTLKLKTEAEAPSPKHGCPNKSSEL